jgi:hypothetical protein
MMDNGFHGAILSKEFQRCRAEWLSRVVHSEQDEDRVAASNNRPLVIVADGVSVRENMRTGRAVLGEGRQAAELAVLEAVAYLEANLCKVDSLEEVLSMLRDLFSSVGRALDAKEVPGATTLLVGLLWESPKGDLFWCYGYEGDGFVTLLSPKRRIEGIVLSEGLLVPQKVEGIAAVSRSGPTVLPAVGCRLYEPGDLLYVATDGLAPAAQWLTKERRMSLSYFLLSRPDQLVDLLTELDKCPSYDDDCAVAVIRTGERTDGQTEH